jgi:hypothetical protein
MSSRIRAALLLLAPLIAAAAEEPASGRTLSKQNVFAGPTTAAAPGQAANETVEFAGISSVGKRTELIFVDKTTKKNYWIAKGETKEGITLLNYDAKREEAVVKINGVQKTLALRRNAKPTPPSHTVPPTPTGFNVAPTPLPAFSPAPASVTPATAMMPEPVPPVPAAAPAPNPPTPNTPEAVAKAETEARMLVSDLLEIGMAQRKAYEEAQRRAAEGIPNPPEPPPAASETPKP